MRDAMRAAAWYGPDGSVHLMFPYDANLIDKLKKIPFHARDFDPNTRIWTITGVYVPAAVRYFRGYFPEAQIIEHDTCAAST